MTNKEKAEWIANSYDGDKISIEDIITACMGMAEWKDKNPSIDTIKKIVSYALKNTNIMLSDNFENDVDWELLIKKALQ